jgi:two-component system sensor histidine kinase QseC
VRAIHHTLQFCFFFGFIAVALLNAVTFHWVMQQNVNHGIIFTTMIVLDFAAATFFYDFAKQSILRPLEKLSKELSIKTSSELETIATQHYATEFQAMLTELNFLFARVHADYDRNKRFSADAAHELRTPMTALKTQAQLALQMTEPLEQRKAIENVIISINRSIHVIQQLLTLSRLDHEEKLNDVAEVNLESVAAELIAFMYPQALEKNIEIELCNECRLPLIKGNEAALGILLRNLIDNAIRYTPINARIDVKIKEHHHSILLQITDNGPGIPEEYRDKVFDRFFRVLGTKQTGSGLGLAIVKQITDLHKAKIHLQTSESGQGLTVTVFFRKPK